jgi:hypothetical protein
VDDDFAVHIVLDNASITRPQPSTSDCSNSHASRSTSRRRARRG